MRTAGATSHRLTLLLAAAVLLAGCSDSGGSTGSTEPSTAATSTSEDQGEGATTSFVATRDTSGAIAVELPAEWTDTMLEPSKFPGGQLLRSDADAVLWASTDLNTFEFGEETEGLIVEASRSLGKQLASTEIGRDPVIGVFFRYEPRLVLTRGCPSARFDTIGLSDRQDTESDRVLGNPRPDLVELARVVIDAIDPRADVGVTASWLCTGGATVVETVFLTADRSTLVYLQYVLPEGKSTDVSTHVFETLRIDPARLPRR